jgi:hypothetical protein
MVIDLQTEIGIADFIVLVDGEEAGFYETLTTDTERTLLIPIMEGSVLIEIVGTRTSNIQPLSQVKVLEQQKAAKTLVAIFIANSVDSDGCSDRDWRYVYEMGNVAWLYLQQYNMHTTLEVMCQSMEDYKMYHPTGSIMMHILDKGQHIPDPAILYDRDEMTVMISGEDIPIYGVAMYDESNGERFYVRPYTLYGNQYYDLEPQKVAWAISHEISHIALHMLGHTEKIYTDWVHREQQMCNSNNCDTESISIKNFVWADIPQVSYNVLKHYK